MEKIRALEAHHHVVISSLLIFGIVVVWAWGSVVWGVSSGTNITVTVGSPDACPNISGYQETVPNGMQTDENGDCYTPPPPPVDVCPNLSGTQTSIPNGYYMTSDSDCVPQPPPPAQPVDVCPNLDGVQSDVPDGFYNLTDGRCVRPPSDLCDNIDGDQYLVPEGMLRADGGVCFTPSTTGDGDIPPTITTVPLLDDPWAAPATPREPTTTANGKTNLRNIPPALQATVQPLVDMVPASVKEALRSLPPVVARTFPYVIFIILGLAATVMTWQAISEIAAVKRLTALLKRERDIAEEKDNFIALASHYMRTPLTLMKGALDTALAIRETTVETSAGLKQAISGLDTQIAAILQAVETNEALGSIKPPAAEKPSSSFVLSAYFWLPIVTTLGIVGLANFFLGVVGDVELGTYNVLMQIAVFVAVSVVFYTAIRNRHLRKAQHEHKARLIKHEETIDQARNRFINDAYAALTAGLTSIAAQRAILNGGKAETFFKDGYDRFDHLLSKFALLAEIQAGVKGQSEDFDVRDAIDALIALYHPQLGERRLTIINNVSSDHVKQRRSLFDFVFGSLIDNAIKFSHEGGTITIGSVPGASSLTVRISDYGVGIPDSKMSQLFKPFSRGTSAMEFNYEGLGFSLFLDKIIMDYLGGKISAESVPNQSSTFSVTTASV